MQAAHFGVAVADVRHIVAAVQVVDPFSVKQVAALATHNVQGGIIGQGCVGADEHAALGYDRICLQYGLLQIRIAGSCEILQYGVQLGQGQVAQDWWCLIRKGKRSAAL